MTADESPTARALMLLEMIQNSPGITAERLSDRLHVTERAVRRYVGILREAGIPVESTRGRYGGYRIGRGARVPPLMFTETEALSLVMAVLDGYHQPASPSEPVNSALGKIMRVLPDAVAQPAAAFSQVRAGGRAPSAPTPAPDITAALVQASASQHAVRIGYDLGRDAPREMHLDPWAVVVRHGRWYLLCWSHMKHARRVLRVDRVQTVDVLPETFEAPADLDPVEALEEHLAIGWSHKVEVVIEAPAEQVQKWIAKSRGRCEPIDDEHTRLIGSTDEPDWYASLLTAIPFRYKVLGSPELVEATRTLAQRLTYACEPPDADPH
ncbi:helix-turn-helix transcriptional regulator [Luteipulveratus mongoliensis]|uniref:DNA-binding protein n=1 Tax=Luteipulveratus mongoliensis TaxID=571913 RepID=A0A0K1JED8_9MICO|nr:WYL domain-containing protein [Luteipulveratus mongoliensis]AKU15069.1 DNA-binding protein [Luteipulveratus mongoliensis]